MELNEKGPILIVDDNRDVRESLGELLRLNGYKVEEAVDGLDAVRRLRKTTPCLILLDLMMPNIDGWTFLSIKENQPAISAIPVIVLSAISDIKPVNASYDMLVKPVNIRLLKRHIDKHLKTARPASPVGRSQEAISLPRSNQRRANFQVPARNTMNN